MPIFGAIVDSLCRYCICKCICNVEIDPITSHEDSSPGHEMEDRFYVILQKLNTVADQISAMDQEKILAHRYQMLSHQIGRDLSPLQRNGMKEHEKEEFSQGIENVMLRERRIYIFFSNFKQGLHDLPLEMEELRNELEKTSRLVDLSFHSLVSLADLSSEQTSLQIPEVLDQGQFWIEKL